MADLSSLKPDGPSGPEYNIKDATARAGIESSKTIKSSVVTVNDAAPINAEDITVDITPVQDLHGYDKPWAGGAWKNKLPMTVARIKAVNTDGTWTGNVYTINDATFEILTDNADNVTGIKVNGTPSSDAHFSLHGFGNGAVFSENAIMTGCPSGGSTNSYNIYISNNTTHDARDTGSGVSLSPELFNSAIYNSLFTWIVISANYTATNLIFYPMIRLATETDATFAPYSNICPIKGRTEVDVGTVGKNELELVKELPFTINGVTFTSDGNGGVYLNGTSTDGIQPGTMWRTRHINGSSCIKRFTSESRDDIVLEGSWPNGYYYSPINGGSDLCNKSGKWGLQAYIPSSGKTFNNLHLTPMVVRGTTVPTEFEPYQKHAATITFGETVYGCTVDFNTGKVVVTKAFESNTWGSMTNLVDRGNGIYSKQLALTEPPKYIKEQGLGSSITNITDNYVYNTNANIHYFVDTVAAVLFLPSDTSNDTVIQVCYELAAPYTLNLTPAQLKMLKGTNTLTSNGATITLKYQPDNVIGELKGEIEDSIIYEDFKWTTESSQSYSAGTPGTYGCSSWRDVKKEGYDVIGVTFVENRRFGDCILTLYYIPSTSRVEVIIFRATSSAVTIADEDIEYRVAYKKRT